MNNQYLPSSPGVYQMLDTLGNILYVGKAKNLKNRVSSYFNRQHQDLKTTALVSQIHRIEIIATSTAEDALILENILIKKNKPKYNILLKDDKNYPFIKIYKAEFYPRLDIVRQRLNDESTYFGPFPNLGSTRKIKRFLQEQFLIRDCTKDIHPTAIQPKCIQLDLNRCLGPCIHKNRVLYQQHIQALNLFLSGQNESILNLLHIQMNALANRLEFEAAGIIRDRIKKLNFFSHRQIIPFTSDAEPEDPRVADLQSTLNLKSSPIWIMGVDISHLASEHIVGATVLFKNGKPYKAGYRLFNIRSVREKSNDPQSIYETVLRRLSLLQDEDLPYPDLILIDGGKAQLNFAISALQELGLSQIPLYALAKKHEELYHIHQPKPIQLPFHTHALHLLQEIRDEVHRFGISIQRKKRNNVFKKTVLSDIPGLGNLRINALLKKFKTIEHLRNAQIEELAKINRIGLKLAGEIKEKLSCQ